MEGRPRIKGGPLEAPLSTVPTSAPSRRALLAAAPLLVLLASPLAGCGGKHKHDLESLAGPSTEWPAQVALAPAVLMHAGQLDLAPQGLTVESRPLGTENEASGSEAPEVGPEVQQAMLGVFYANLYVGKVWHSGGFELLPEVGNQVRSLGLGFSLQGEYAQQVQEWTDAALGEVLTLGGTAWSPAPESVEAALVAPLVRKVRGTGPLDGEDNQNLPRFTLEPQPLDPAALPAIDAPALLVPVVVHYYAHNGGWFVGQAQGTPAGARFRLLWVLHDTKTGAVRTWGDVSARYVEPYFYTPNDVQLQDYLLQVEAQVRDGLERQLAR